jgi:iron complex outermembrane receptor protein
MLIGKPTLRRGLLAAFSAAAVTASLSTTAFAAAPAAAAAEELQEVVVTGSILRRTDTETPAPVTVITAESLQDRGIDTVAEGLQRLTVNGSGTLNSGWNGAGGNFASGASAASLRGLSVQATLTVFDGVRMALYPFADDGHRNFVDMNTIPDSVVDRIEVLKDGASSTYGADAIAGVINVITKKEVVGAHVNGTVGSTVRGGGTERRIDATWGTGKLDSDGYNFYVSGEFQKTDPIWARNLPYPQNSENLNGICDAAGHCMVNNDIWGITNGKDDNGVPFSLITGTTTSYAPEVAPATVTGGRLAPYQLLNPTAGCNLLPGLFPVIPTAQQLADSGQTGVFSPGSTYCGADRRNRLGQLQGEEKRTGFFTRYTAKIGDRAEAYASVAYYDAKEQSNFMFSTNFANQTTVPSQVTLSPVVLPIYVCAGGVGSFVGTHNVSTGCTNANGTPIAGATLNPNNPFAAAGQYARLLMRFDAPRSSDTDAKSLRGALGLTGSFGNDWNYSTDFTYSKVKVQLTQGGNIIPQNLANAIANGSFNFVNPAANSASALQAIAPDDVTNSHSTLWQAQVTLSKKLIDLAGGPLQAAVGASYRHEELVWQSANPDNVAAPYTRYYGVNSVGADGSRNVQSPFFEVDAPFIKQFEANLSGRYDKYSSGQKNFSPKLGLKYKPIEQLAVRGTYSKGFRIPSFNEAFGLPVTGFSGAQVGCTAGTPYAAFCAAHGNNAYASSPYTLGETTTGNPTLNPEKSRSYTLGLVIEPHTNVSMTVDYWNIEVKDLISKLSSGDRTAAISQYYLNNGVVNIPGITVTPGLADTAFPNALPLLGYVASSFNNSDKENASGIDFGINTTVPLGNGLKWNAELQTSWLQNYTITRKNGDKERYAGTLSPCDYTSCSGSPSLRATLSNTLAWEKLSITGTAYYTSPYNLAEVDYGGDRTDCAGSANNGAGSPTYAQTSIPVLCSSKAIWNFDLNGKYKINDKVVVYLDALNVFNIQAPFDPAAAYNNAYFNGQYNIAFATENAIGRFVRLGLRADF